MARTTQVFRPKAAARRSRIHGTGLFATEDIQKGERIIEYTGEKITKAESDRRYIQQEKKGRIYLFDLNKRYDIDGSNHGNDAKYANHSCDPNAESDVVAGRVWILAKRNIKDGDEITYDYNFPSDDHEERPCRCGSARCKGYIVGDGAYRYLKQKWKKQAVIDKKKAARPGGRPGVRVARSPIHGKGLFATTPLFKDEKIVEYTGQRITKDESARRYDEQLAAGEILLFELDDDHDLDGSVGDNLARYANHSCDPNADTDVEDGRVWLEAKRDIAAGEEITYDYNLGATDWRERPCRCGSGKCRRYIVGRDAYYYLRRKMRSGRNGHGSRNGSR